MVRKLLRFRLSGLLLLTTVVACLVGWYAAAAKIRKQELATLDALDESLRGYILHSYNDGDGPTCGTGLAGEATFVWVGPPGVVKEFLVSREVDAFFQLEKLSLREWCTPIDDQCIKHLVKLSSLKRLEVLGSKLSPEGLEQLSTGLTGVCIVVHYFPDDEHYLGESAPASAASGEENPFDPNFGGEEEGNPFDN